MKIQFPVLCLNSASGCKAKADSGPSFMAHSQFMVLGSPSGAGLERSGIRAASGFIGNVETAERSEGITAQDFMTRHPAPVDSAREAEQTRSGCPAWKRCLDIFVLLLGLSVVLPVMLVVGLLIKVVSKGPIFFRQQRIGYLGKPFTCWKFRTMHVNAAQGLHREHVGKLIANNLPLVKLDAKGDKRLIPLGRVLRASCVDEIPQLINVLLGEMSLVGPRPCMDYEYEQLQPWQRQRFNTPPGMTGLWQIKRRSDTSFNQMMQMDLEDIAKRSLWKDMMILIQTVPSVFAQIREARAAKCVQVAEAKTA